MHVCACIYVCSYVDTSTRLYVCVYVSINICCVHVDIFVCMQTCINVYVGM